MNNITVVFSRFLCKQSSHYYFESELILIQNETFEKFIDSKYVRRQFQVVILNDIRFNNFHRSILQLI